MKVDADPNLLVYFGELYLDATRGHLSTYGNWLAPVYQSRMKDEREQNPLVGARAD